MEKVKLNAKSKAKSKVAYEMIRKTAYKALTGAVASATLLVTGMHSGLAADHGREFAALADADQWQFLDQYCTQCHNFDDYSGGLDLTTIFIEEVPDEADTFENVIRKLRSRMMPPPGQTKPSEENTDRFVAWLESYLDEAAEQHYEPHGKPIHRLNRKEYANAIRDLLGLDINPAEMLPEDSTSDGFDNIAEALQVSPVFIDQYVSAAREIVEQAVGQKNPGAGSVLYRPSEPAPVRAMGGGSQQFHIEGAPLGTRGGMVIEHWFPADGEYEINVGDFNLSAWMYYIEFENTMVVTVDGEKVYETVIGGDKDRHALDRDQGAPMDDINGRTKNIRFTTSAGPRKVGVNFVRRSFAESDNALQHFVPGALQERIINIPSVEIRGPFNPAGLSTTPTRERIFSCYPATTAEERACAESIITEFATKAYRRPLTEEDTAPLYAFYAAGRERGDFEEGIRLALTRTLASPHFLFRAELPPEGAQPGVYALSSLEMASRLSFFLWSSLPDQELLSLAMADRLQEPEILQAQVRRMLADPKSVTLASNFAFQWLGLGKLEEISPDPEIFPYASDAGDLRPDFTKELELFVDSIFREDQSILRLLDADHTYLNERLALHYGIHDVKGTRFRRVTLEDPRRFGVLGKGGVLMASSYPNRTSPVIRGAWVLETLMGTPPPIPPPDVEDLAENEAGQPASTVRERLEQHRQNPTCNSCHAVMDPLGFALDNFDAVGRWRDRDRYTGTTVDASGLLPNGKVVEGPEDLRLALLERPDMLAMSLTEKLLTYALGRNVEAHDMPIVRAIVRESAKDDYRFSSLVLNIVNSPAFKTKKVTDLTSLDNSADVAQTH